jgi:hypothetical protein
MRQFKEMGDEIHIPAATLDGGRDRRTRLSLRFELDYEK